MIWKLLLVSNPLAVWIAVAQLIKLLIYLARKPTFRNISMLPASLVLFLANPAICDLSKIQRNPEENRLYRSAYYLGRGDTGISDADDEEAIFYNPAGLAVGSGIYKKLVLASPHLQVSTAARDIYKRLVIDKEEQSEVLRDQVAKPMHVSVSNLSALVLRRAAIGAYVSSDVNLLVRKDPDFGGVETVNADMISNRVMTFSLAEGFLDNKLLVGGTGKYIQRGQGRIEANILDAESIKKMGGSSVLRSGSGTGLDLGLMLKSGMSKFRTEHSFGLTINDLGNTQFVADKAGEDLDPILQTVNVGYSLELGTKYSRMKLLADFRDATGAAETKVFKRTHLGSEISVLDMIGATAGLHQGYVSGGFFFNLRLLRIDAGFYTVERGDYMGQYPDQRYFLRVMVGI